MKKMKKGNNRIFMSAQDFIVRDIIIPRTSILLFRILLSQELVFRLVALKEAADVGTVSSL
jgi:hypothetical protein